MLHFPHTPQTLWPHPSPSLIGFFKNIFACCLSLAIHGQSKFPELAHKLKEIMATVLVGWWTEMDVWRWLWCCGAGVWSLTVLSVVSYKTQQKLGHLLCSESCVLTALDVKHVVCFHQHRFSVCKSENEWYISACHANSSLKVVTVLPQW